MKHFRLALVVMGSSLAVAGALLACSSDDTIVTNNDGGPDTNDAGQDTGVSDSDTKDSGDPDVLIDAGLTFESFRSQLAETFCQSVARCCFGNANLAQDSGVDGGFYDQGLCHSQLQAGGFEGSLDYNQDAGTPLILNQAQALECLAKLKVISCQLPRAEFAAARAACFNAVRGTAVIGGACSTGIDCVPGSFCNRSTSKCEALRGDDGGCGDFSTESQVGEEACSWRGSGDTNRYCHFFDFTGGVELPPAEWRCRTARDNGQPCVNSLWCGQGLCDDRNDLDTSGEADYVCRSPMTYFPPTPDYCLGFVKP